MFGNSALERTNSLLVAENSDLRRTLREERDAWAAERSALVDRIIALSNPQAATLLRPERTRPSVSLSIPVTRKINQPATVSVPLPPYPQSADDKAN